MADHGDAVALLDPHSERSLTYRALSLAAEAVAEQLARSERQLVMLRTDNSIDCIVALLAVLRARQALFLVNRSTSRSAVAGLIERYRPDFVIGFAGEAREEEWTADGWTDPFALYGRMFCWRSTREPGVRPHADLALVLSTSGSVGSPKAVRLSAANLAANAHQIVEALDIQAGTRAALSLPLAYTYGLSVLTSHLLAGAALVTQARSVMDPLFWRGCASGSVETLPTVTFMLEFMAGAPWGDLRPPSLKTVTHAGGRLSPQALQWLQDRAAAEDLRILRMYGMTEATARLSVLPPDEFLTHAESVGRAVAGGAFEIDAGGQVIYRGPNVMMGYAESRAELGLGDLMRGRLETGDLGWLDEGGRLTLTGRLRRLAKILGHRLNLADMEDYLSGSAETAIVSDDQHVIVYHTLAPDHPLDALNARLCAEFRLPPQTVRWRRIGRLPRTESGKILYGELVG